MELDAARVHLVRPYIFDYIVGVLWLVLAGITTSSTAGLLGVAMFIDRMAVAMSHTTVPSFVVGFFLVVGGIILPYCVAIVFKMPTLWLMNGLLALQRLLDKSEGAALKATKLEANAVVQRSAGSSLIASSNLVLLYLETFQPSVAANLRGARQDIDFRASATLPIALIVGTALGRLMGAWLVEPAATTVGLLSGLASFLTSVWATNKSLDLMHKDLAMAVLITDRKSPAKDVTANPVAAPEANEPRSGLPTREAGTGALRTGD